MYTEDQHTTLKDLLKRLKDIETDLSTFADDIDNDTQETESEAAYDALALLQDVINTLEPEESEEE